MKPLLFLTFKTFVNGVKRALSSPTRLIGLLFFTAYYFMWFVRPYMGGRGIGRGMPESIGGRLEFPPLEIVDAVVFTGFSALSLFMMLGGLAQQGAFKPADVDMLFPTPIHPRTVLAFRMIRDYLLTLIVPFFLLLIGFGPAKAGFSWLFKNLPNPEHAGLVVRAAFLSWLLMAMCWIAINYAISLFINRSDEASEKNKRALGWSMAGLVVATGAFIAWNVSRMDSAGQLLDLAQSPILRSVFFVSTFATHLTMAPLTGAWGYGLYGILSMLALICGSLYIAMTQVAWMYDQAAVKGFGMTTLRAAQRQGDTLAAAAYMARTGRLAPRKLKFLYNMRAPGPWALVWKDLFLQARGLLWMLVMLVLVGVGMIALVAFIPSSSGETPETMFLFMQAMAIFTVTLALSNMGYLEVLRRIDLQKPLPFSPPTIVFFEVGSKAILGIIVSLLGSLIAVIIKPSLATQAAAAAIFAPPLSLLLCSTVFLVIILFPDVEDQTQRQFRGMLMMLSLAIMGMPPVLLFGFLVLQGAPMVVAALFGAIVCFGIAVLGAIVSGKLYANFNPSE